MKTVRLFLFALLAMISLTGCLQIEKVVKLNADGSGTVEVTLIMARSAIEGMKQMTAGFGAAKEGGDKPFEFFDEAKIKAAAEKMGEGVTLVSSTKISSEQGEGYKAVYAFKDINKLKVDQNPGDSMPTSNGVKPGGDKRTSEPVVFQFTKGSPAELTATLPQPDFKPKIEQPAGMEDMAMQMMKQVFKDMKITLVVEVAGTIKETNAEYREGNRVTLMEMDMNKVLADPEKFRAMAKANPQTVQETKKLMKGIDGIKIESAPEVKIKFQ